ncbi:hypothetical protein [Bacillus safensis]|uniref:hypothetical protein n=1 Tax=Bacillus safensis TaxID=561879 RepID=UPI003839653D
MTYAKVIVFIVGIFLANYVGGIPNDARNLFITQTIFFVPYLIDFYPLVLMKSQLKYLTHVIFSMGIIIFSTNILGIMGVIIIENNRILFNQDYVTAVRLNIELNNYLLIAGIIYVIVFIGTLMLKVLLEFNSHFEEKKRNKGKKQSNIKQKDVAI